MPSPKRFTNEQIAFALRPAENGGTVDEVCRPMGVSEPTLDRCKKRFVGMGVPEIRRLKQLGADLTLDRAMLRDVLERRRMFSLCKSLWFVRQSATGILFAELLKNDRDRGRAFHRVLRLPTDPR